MWAIASAIRSHRLEVGWGVFALANLIALPLVGGWETIPFHFIWVSLTLLYGPRVWRLRTTAIVLLAVSLSTGLVYVWLGLRGEAEWAELSEVPLMAAMFVAMVWYARRYQRAADDLRRAAEREREFVRDASHQLRTPITVARGHAELLRRTITHVPAVEDADVILEELSRLATISDRLLLIAASEQPGFLRLEPVDIEWLLLHAARRWRAGADRAWEVQVSMTGRLLADEDRLATALDAMIENAVKFTRSGDPIRIAARGSRDTAVIEVSDGGIGIPPSHLPRIFDRFASGEVRPIEGSRGTGLGLAMVRAIVNAHGGAVAVSSTMGSGTTFTITLPGLRPGAADANGGDVGAVAAAAEESVDIR